MTIGPAFAAMLTLSLKAVGASFCPVTSTLTLALERAPALSSIV